MESMALSFWGRERLFEMCSHLPVSSQDEEGGRDIGGPLGRPPALTVYLLKLIR